MTPFVIKFNALFFAEVGRINAAKPLQRLAVVTLFVGESGQFEIDTPDVWRIRMVLGETFQQKLRILVKEVQGAQAAVK